MAGRPHISTLIAARAECQRCAWNVSSNNAQALAAQHFDNKGHQVRVTTTMEILYGRAAATAGGKARKQENLL